MGVCGYWRGAERMYYVHATREMLPCLIVARRRLVGRSDRYRIQTLRFWHVFGSGCTHVGGPSLRLSDGKIGEGG